MFGFKRWRASQLLWSWCPYWVALVLVSIGPGLLAAWRISRPGGHGTVTGGFENGIVQMTVTNGVAGTADVWKGSASLSAVVLWIAVPPLALWVGWLASRPRHGLAGGHAGDALSAPMDESSPRQDRAERRPVRRGEGPS